MIIPVISFIIPQAAAPVSSSVPVVIVFRITGNVMAWMTVVIMLTNRVAVRISLTH